MEKTFFHKHYTIKIDIVRYYQTLQHLNSNKKKKKKKKKVAVQN